MYRPLALALLAFSCDAHPTWCPDPDLYVWWTPEQRAACPGSHRAPGGPGLLQSTPNRPDIGIPPDLLHNRPDLACAQIVGDKVEPGPPADTDPHVVDVEPHRTIPAEEVVRLTLSVQNAPNILTGFAAVSSVPCDSIARGTLRVMGFGAYSPTIAWMDVVVRDRRDAVECPGDWAIQVYGPKLMTIPVKIPIVVGPRRVNCL